MNGNEQGPEKRSLMGRECEMRTASVRLIEADETLISRADEPTPSRTAELTPADDNVGLISALDNSIEVKVRMTNTSAHVEYILRSTPASLTDRLA